jgi:LacI family transcriptional regulator
VLDACRALRLEVPAQIAVVAACNEDWWEFFAGVSMSYIPLQFEQIGYEAAALLQRLVEGGVPPREPMRIPPGRLVVQESSDVYPYADEAVRVALRFIEANLHRPFRIAELLATVPCSRRKLEMCIKHDTGRTLEKRVLEARVEKARMLLAETNLPIKEIAEQCGFRERERLHVAFRKGTGVTPACFRRLHHRQPSP